MKLSDDELKSLWQQDTIAIEKRANCLSSDLLVRAGEDKLSAEERTHVASHLASCADCAEEYQIALSAKEWAVASADRHAAAFPSRPVTNVLPSVVANERWWQRAAAGLFPVMKSPALALGAVLSAILLATVGWLAWQVLQKKEPKQELATTSPSPITTSSATPVTTPTATVMPVPETLVAQLNDGQALITLDTQGRLAGADNLPSTYQRMVKEAMTTQRIERSPSLTGLRVPSSSLRGGDEQENTFTLTEPVGKVVLSDRPVFRWSSLRGATGYVVEVYDEKFNQVASSPQLNAPSWTASQSLKRGGVYAWQVRASKDGQEVKAPRPNAPEATFRVLDQAKANEVTQARRAYATSHLTLGLIYAQAGLLDEAEGEFRALQKANPDSTVARRLLANVRALRR